MFIAHTVVIALHVLFAATWFGLSLSLPALARPANGDAKVASAGDRIISMMGISVILFYLTGLGAFVMGARLDFPYGWPIHVAMTLGLLLVAVHYLLLRKAWPKAVNGVGSIGMALGIGHLLWLSMFVLMYLQRLGVGL